VRVPSVLTALIPFSCLIFHGPHRVDKSAASLSNVFLFLCRCSASLGFFFFVCQDNPVLPSAPNLAFTSGILRRAHVRSLALQRTVGTHLFSPGLCYWRPPPLRGFSLRRGLIGIPRAFDPVFRFINLGTYFFPLSPSHSTPPTYHAFFFFPGPPR